MRCDVGRASGGRMHASASKSKEGGFKGRCGYCQIFVKRVAPEGTLGAVRSTDLQRGRCLIETVLRFSMEEEEEEVWVCNACTFRNQASRQACTMCYTMRPGLPWLFQHYGNSLSICSVQRFLTNMLSGALTGVFALLGAFTGAITGALAGRAAQSGLLRGAGLGALAGAVLSVEVLEASWSYWHSERSGASASPSMSDFIEDFLSGRFVQEFVVPAVSATQRWQLNIAEMSYEELYEMFIPAEGRMKGASEEFLQSLPKHIITQGNRIDASGDVICCAICLQELEEGAIARTLPSCNHTFHLNCVDRWLVKRVICPVCRQYM